MTFGRKYIQDLFASLVVFLIALPLSIGIAIASGLPLDQAAPKGLLTAAIGGIVGGTLGGSWYLIRGPAAGLVAVVVAIIQRVGYEDLFIVVILSGLLQVLIGALRFGPIFRSVSPALVDGMISGIGVLIIISQAYVLLDLKPPSADGITNLIQLPQAIFRFLWEPHLYPAGWIGPLTIGVF